jgi:hypothetical protein
MKAQFVCRIVHLVMNGNGIRRRRRFFSRSIVVVFKSTKHTLVWHLHNFYNLGMLPRICQEQRRRRRFFYHSKYRKYLGGLSVHMKHGFSSDAITDTRTRTLLLKLLESGIDPLVPIS